jgi:hypothetical protein
MGNSNLPEDLLRREGRAEDKIVLPINRDGLS